MKIFRHLWQYVAEFFLELEMFQIKVVEKIRTHILCPVTFSRKSCRLWDNVENYGGAREAADGKWRRVACWVSKATHAESHARACAYTHTHTQHRNMQYLLLFHGHNCYAKAPRCPFPVFLCGIVSAMSGVLAAVTTKSFVVWYRIVW